MARLLLFIDTHAMHIGTVRDHVYSLKRFSDHEIHLAEYRSAVQKKIALDYFDAVIFHYSVVIAQADRAPGDFLAHCRAFRGLKILLIQDEYRWIDDTVKAAIDLGIDVIFTVVNRNVIDVIYGHPALSKVRKEQTLTGFVPEQFLNRRVAPFALRPVDVGYRGRSVPFWLGAFAQEKRKIGERFEQDAGEYGLVTDIDSDEKSRLYGKKWVRFLTRCKAVLGTESGASICDFTGDIQRRVDSYIAENSNASFEEVQREVLADHDGKHLINVISPRCFEAAALRTLMILYPGNYSGLLEPWRHYVPLAKDHSNMAEVVSILRSPERAQQIIDAAYQEVACNPSNTFRNFVRHFDEVVAEELHRREAECVSNPKADGRSSRVANTVLRWELARSRLKSRMQLSLRHKMYMTWRKYIRPYLPSEIRVFLRYIAIRIGLA